MAWPADGWLVDGWLASEGVPNHSTRGNSPSGRQEFAATFAKDPAGCSASAARSRVIIWEAFGLYWDDKLLKKLEKLDWKPLMLKRYVDDLNTVVIGVKPGTRYNAAEDKLEVVEDQIESDEEKDELPYDENVDDRDAPQA